MVSLTWSRNQHFKNTPTTAVAGPASQQTVEKGSFPAQRRFPSFMAFLVPAELPFQRSKTLSYRDKMELKWLLMKRF
jgi:hypothetical protein